MSGTHHQTHSIMTMRTAAKMARPLVAMSRFEEEILGNLSSKCDDYLQIAFTSLNLVVGLERRIMICLIMMMNYVVRGFHLAMNLVKVLIISKFRFYQAYRGKPMIFPQDLKQLVLWRQEPAMGWHVKVKICRPSARTISNQDLNEEDQSWEDSSTCKVTRRILRLIQMQYLVRSSLVNHGNDIVKSAFKGIIRNKGDRRDTIEHYKDDALLHMFECHNNDREDSEKLDDTIDDLELLLDEDWKAVTHYTYFRKLLTNVNPTHDDTDGQLLSDVTYSSSASHEESYLDDETESEPCVVCHDAMVPRTRANTSHCMLQLISKCLMTDGRIAFD